MSAAKEVTLEAQRLELADTIHHSFGASRMPYRDNKRGIRVAPNRRFRRLDGNAFTDATPQGWIVVAEQNWLDGLSKTPTEIAGTENHSVGRRRHQA